MEKTAERLREAAEIARQIECDNENCHVDLLIREEGIHAKLLFKHNEEVYKVDSITSWYAIHPRPDTNNPFIAVFDDLVKQMTRFLSMTDIEV